MRLLQEFLMDAGICLLDLLRTDNAAFSKSIAGLSNFNLVFARCFPANEALSSLSSVR